MKKVKGKVTKIGVYPNISVETLCYYLDRKYRKEVKQTKSYLVHAKSRKDYDSCVLGEAVEIISCKPISKTKTWLLIKD